MFYLEANASIIIRLGLELGIVLIGVHRVPVISVWFCPGNSELIKTYIHSGS